MRRAAPENRAPEPLGPAQPTAEHAELALREAAALMAPVVLWLLRNGVSYPDFAEMLKPVFLDAARAEIARGGAKPTQSALSLLSGVHRKDVRAFEQEPHLKHPTPRPPLASQVFTRWVTDPRYRGADGKPRALPRSGAGRSFETLCRSLSNDVHPRSVLDELLRLGHVALNGEKVSVLAAAFVPSRRLDEMTSLFASNASDHIAAAVSNLTLSAPKFLEQSIYADGLTPESVEHLHQVARAAWAQAFDTMVTQARARVDLDAKSDGALRMRYGTYFFSEPSEAEPPGEPKKAPAAKPRAPAAGRATRRKA